MPKAIPITAKARARSFGAVTSAMYACAMERFPAVSPSMIRATNTMSRFGAQASTRKPANVPIWLAISTGLRPRWSESWPSTGPATSWHRA
jgi:hypothetical protein